MEDLDHPIIYPTITTTQNNHLIKPVIEEEIEHVLKAMDPDKAPKPDRFPSFFFKKY